MLSLRFHELFEDLLKDLSYSDLIELDNCFTTIQNLYVDLRHELNCRAKIDELIKMCKKND